MIGISSSNILSSISSDTTESDFSSESGTNYNNKWGFNYAKNDAISDIFHPSPTTTGVTIDATNTPGNNTYHLAIGARANINTPMDSYSNTYVLFAVGNPTPYTINYNKNTTDEVTNMPSPNPDSGSVSGDATFVSNTVPARTDYTFKGWCSVVTADETCSGTTYNPDGGGTDLSLALDQTGANNITLYAMWLGGSSPKPLYDTVAGLVKKDGTGSPKTQTTADLKVALTQPTSNNPTEDTSNSGVYKYNPTAFGAASDGGTTHDIYYYRGILDTADHTGKYGSDGDADAYPNYVKLKDSDICWRIVRTTGSGGIKMVYNGTWSGSTCARNQTYAQVMTRTYDITADSKSKSIVGLGYTYNADYVATTANTQAGILFGTNDDFSGNTTDTSIKNYIENTWYDDNMADYTDLLEPSAGYCGDRSVNTKANWTVYSDETNITTPYTTGSTATAFYFGARMRNHSTYQNPTIGCPRNIVDLYTTADATNGNKKLTKPAALLTADEIAFAGSGSNSPTQGSVYNANSFLNSGSSSWTLSPFNRYSSGTANMYYLGLGGYLVNATTQTSLGVRPAISLKNSAYVYSGNGTSTNPWIVDEAPSP